MKLYEFEPTGDQVPLAIHEEGSLVLTCARCGCRLTARESLPDGGGYGPDAAWRHFHGAFGRDARGCLVNCLDAPHRIRPEDSAAA